MVRSRNDGNDVAGGIIRMELPSLIERKQEIPGCFCAGVHAHIDGHPLLVGREIDFPDDRGRRDVGPVADIFRTQGIDAKPVASVGGCIFRRNGKQGNSGEINIVVPEILRARSPGIRHARLVFHPDRGIMEVGKDGIPAGPDGPERAQPDRGDIADGDVGINREDALRSLVKFRRVRVDAGRRAQKQGQYGQVLSHQNRMLRLM